MTYVIATADKVTSGHGISFSGAIALVVVAMASGVATWATYPANSISDTASSEDTTSSEGIRSLLFDTRFVSGSAPNLLSTDFQQPFVQSLPSDREIKLQQAKERLAQKLQFQDRRTAVMEEPTPSSVAAVPLPNIPLPNIPLPKSRPVRRTSSYGTVLLLLNLIIARYCRSSPICSRPVSRLRLYLPMVGS